MHWTQSSQVAVCHDYISVSELIAQLQFAVDSKNQAGESTAAFYVSCRYRISVEEDLQLQSSSTNASLTNAIKLTGN